MWITKKTCSVFSSILFRFSGYFLIVQTIDVANYKEDLSCFSSILVRFSGYFLFVQTIDIANYQGDLSCFLFDSRWIFSIFLLVQTIDIANYKEDLPCFLFDSLWMSGIFSPRPDVWHWKLQRRPVLFSIRLSLDVGDNFSSSRRLTLQTTKKTCPVSSFIIFGC